MINCSVWLIQKCYLCKSRLVLPPTAIWKFYAKLQSWRATWTLSPFLPSPCLLLPLSSLPPTFPLPITIVGELRVDKRVFHQWRRNLEFWAYVGRRAHRDYKRTEPASQYKFSQTRRTIWSSLIERDSRTGSCIYGLLIDCLGPVDPILNWNKIDVRIDVQVAVPFLPVRLSPFAQACTEINVFTLI